VHGGQQHAGRRRDARIKAKLADDEVAGQGLTVDRAHRGEQAERDRQIVMRAFLGQICGREIDRDALRRQRQADRGERGVNPLAAFVDRLVRQSDHQEFGQPGRDLDLHLDAARLQPQERHRGDMRDHFEWSPLRLAAFLWTGDGGRCRGRADRDCFQAGGEATRPKVRSGWEAHVQGRVPSAFVPRSDLIPDVAPALLLHSHPRASSPLFRPPPCLVALLIGDLLDLFEPGNGRRERVPRPRSAPCAALERRTPAQADDRGPAGQFDMQSSELGMSRFGDKFQNGGWCGRRTGWCSATADPRSALRHPGHLR
jgi:hypothetical protein